MTLRSRRLCRSPFHEGPRYVSWTDFYAKTWGDTEGTWVAQFQSQCMACQRISARIRQGVKRRTGHTITQLQTSEPTRSRSVVAYLAAVMEHAYEPRSKLPPEVAAERKRQRYRDWVAKPENREKRRSDNRDNARMIAMERGQVTNPRGPQKRHRTVAPSVDPAPLLDWLRDSDLEHLSDVLQRRVRDARRDPKVRMDIGTIDRILVTLSAEHVLSSLYPDSCLI